MRNVTYFNFIIFINKFIFHFYLLRAPVVPWHAMSQREIQNLLKQNTIQVLVVLYVYTFVVSRMASGINEREGRRRLVKIKNE